MSRRYVRTLYNSLERTFVPSPILAALLRDWGVERVESIDLGVDADVFRPNGAPSECVAPRAQHSRQIAACCSTSGVWRRKRTFAPSLTPLKSFIERTPNQYHLLTVGDGALRPALVRLREQPNASPGFSIARNRPNWRPSIARRTCSCIPASRKPSDWSPLRARRAALRSSASAAVTWTASFSPISATGQPKTRRDSLARCHRGKIQRRPARDAACKRASPRESTIPGRSSFSGIFSLYEEVITRLREIETIAQADCPSFPFTGSL